MHVELTSDRGSEVAVMKKRKKEKKEITRRKIQAINTGELQFKIIWPCVCVTD
jgi:hypothetical protein